MNFVIAIYGAPFTQQSSTTAWHFAEAVIKQGHHVSQVFFYLDGVQNANNYISIATDEKNWIAAWQDLAEQNNVELIVCSTAAKKRGITKKNLANKFKLAGLVQYLQAVMHADYSIVFGY